MKVNRYLYGRTNIGQLESGRASLRSPQEVAKGEYAPYGAIAQAADSITGDIQQYREKRARKQDAIERSAVAVGLTSLNNDLRNWDIEARQKNLSREEYLEGANTRIDQYEGEAFNDISERNIPLYEEKITENIANYRATSLLSGDEIWATQASTQYKVNLGKLAEDRNWEAYGAMVEVARMDETRTLLSEEELAVAETAHKDWLTAEKAFAGYPAARTRGEEEEYIGGLDSEDMTAGAWDKFSALRVDHDNKTAKIEFELKQQKAKDYYAYYHTISPATDIDEINAYIEENDITGEQVGMLYSRKYAKDTAKSLFDGPFLDPTVQANRDAANELVTGDTPKEWIENAFVFTAENGISPSGLTAAFNGGLTAGTANEIRTFGDYYLKYDEIQGNIPLPMGDTARATGEFYKMNRLLGMDPVTASTITVNQFDGVNEQVIRARKDAWDDPEMGSDSGKTPKAIVWTQIKEKLSDPASTWGQRFIADLGSLPWGLSQNDINDIQIPSLMRTQSEEVAKSLYLASDSEQVAINGVLPTLFAAGWGATDINRGINYTSYAERGYQFQQHPVTKVSKKPASVIRSDLSSAMTEKYVSVMNAIEPPRTYSESEVELGDGEWDSVNKRYVWPVMFQGGALIHADDGTPVMYRLREDMVDAEKTDAERQAADKLLKIQEGKVPARPAMTIDHPAFKGGG